MPPLQKEPGGAEQGVGVGEGEVVGEVVWPAQSASSANSTLKAMGRRATPRGATSKAQKARAGRCEGRVWVRGV